MELHMLLSILVIYVLFVLVVVLISYYADLIIKKEEYTRDDLKNIVPYFGMLWENAAQKYSLFNLISILFISSFISILLTLVSSSMILNSSILFLVVYFVLPVISGNLEKSRVTDGGSFYDLIANIVMKYHDLIIIGFGFGTGSALLYSWGGLRQIHFIWFLLNVVIVIVLTEIKLRQSIQQ